MLRLLISNINLAVQNMYNYVNKIAVILPHDKDQEEKKKNATIEQQLEAVIAHIEDLVEVNNRVKQMDSADYYGDALPSKKNTIRLDF